jgi:hypothetical protein
MTPTARKQLIMSSVTGLDFLKTPVEKRATKGERIIGQLLPSGRTGWPGGWSQDRLQFVNHMTNWNYVAVHATASKLAQLVPNMAYVRYDEIPGRTEKYQYSAPNAYGGTNVNGMPSGCPYINGSQYEYPTKGGYYRKALSVIKPHENLEPIEHNHLCRRILENPNPFDTMFDFFYEWTMFEELCGVAYIWKVPNKWGRTCELYVIPSHWVWPRTGAGKYVTPNNPHADELIQYYEIRPWGGMGSAGMLYFPPNEVIRSSWKSPLNKIDGYSPLAATAQWSDVEESISKSRWSQMTYGAYPALHIELPVGYEDPNDDRIARIESKFMQKYAGESNYGRPIFTPSGSKLLPLGFAPSEMAYYESENQIRDMILSVRGIPKTAIGIAENMTYGSVLATLASWCSMSLVARLTMRGQRLTKDLGGEWDDEEGAIRIWYDDPTPVDPAQLNSDLEADWGMMAVSPNEIRAIRGRKSWKLGGDNPMGQGPGGIVPYPLNVEEKSEDLNKLVDKLVQDQNQGGPGGGMPGMPGMPGAEAGGEHPEAEGESQGGPAEIKIPENDTGIEKPNGKPSKSLVKDGSAVDAFLATTKSTKPMAVLKAVGSVVKNGHAKELEQKVMLEEIKSLLKERQVASPQQSLKIEVGKEAKTKTLVTKINRNPVTGLMESIEQQIVEDKK